MALLTVTGSSGCSSRGASVGSAEATKTVGAHMAGAVVDVQITQAAFDAKPRPWVLTTPESAVSSYIDWVSYAWRIARSDVATPTMSAYEEVRVDSYIQYNIQKNRLIDQTLTSITFGKPKISGSRAVLPAKETWKYRYVSIKIAGKTVGGPYSASYDATYTVVRSTGGNWVVDSVKAKPLDEVK